MNADLNAAIPILKLPIGCLPILHLTLQETMFLLLTDLPFTTVVLPMILLQEIAQERSPEALHSLPLGLYVKFA